MSRKGENIFRRKDGRWEARYIHHYESGRAVYRFIYGKTYTEAKEKRKLLISVCENEKHTGKKSDLTFEDLCKKWLSDVKLSVKESTYTRYERIVTKYVLSNIGNPDMLSMDARRINSFAKELLLFGGLTGKGLSPKSVSDVLCVLKSILKFGVMHGEIDINLDGIRHPQKEGKQIEVLSDANRTRLEKILFSKKSPLNLGIMLSLFCGLRIGEICGLRWGDVDFEGKTLSVLRSVERISNIAPFAKNKTKVIICEPKTKNSIRTIPLQEFIIHYAKDVFLKEKTKNPHFTTNSAYILTGNEKPTEPHNFYMRYKRFMKRAGIEGYSFHALRHTFATRCVEVGFDPKSLAEILGHSSVTTTLSVYVHPTLAQKRAQMDRIIPDLIGNA